MPDILNSCLYAFFYLIGLLGEPIIWVFIGLIELVVFLSVKKEFRDKLKIISLELFSAIFVSTAIVSALKLFFRIPRPCFGQAFCPLDFSFPSGHAGAAFAVFVFLALNTKNNFYRAGLIFSAVIVTYSRVYIGVHTWVDVFAGAFIGVIVGVVISFVVSSHSSAKKSALFEMLKIRR
ncbi:MAG: phosphatase PAP2 family protein [Candidatus Diapherotrites archaeon]|nr:phosphatase PAP2 family protein [Candidatus Diapherotrites archaeon]